MIDVSKIIRLDKYTQTTSPPHLTLMKRDFSMIGNIPFFNDWNIVLNANSTDEISFSVNKYTNGNKCPVWDDLVDLKIVDVDGLARFEIQVNYTDNTETVKSVTGISLECELAQVTLYELHVNDEDVLAIDDRLKADSTNVDWEYKNGSYDFIPTCLYKANDENHSLLHRVLKDKAPHWTIDTSKMALSNYIAIDDDETTIAIPIEQFQRTYTVDGTTIYDFLTGDVAEQSNVIFDFDTVHRKISCRCLSDCYIKNDAGERVLVQNSYGEDTTILVSKEKLATEISISSDKDSVKNCFRVEGGDDIITNYVRAVNMSGSNYIYQFSDFQYDDMPDELVEKIKEYQEMMTDDYDIYNAPLSDPVQTILHEDDKYYEITSGGIYPRLTYAYKQEIYYESGMMPEVDTSDKYKKEAAKYSSAPQNNAAYWAWRDMSEAYFKNDKNLKLNGSTVGVASFGKVASTNNVEAMAEVYIDSRYSVEVVDKTVTYTEASDKSSATWKGVIVLTSDSDETIKYPQVNTSGNYDANVYTTVTIKKDADNATSYAMMPYTTDKIKKSLASTDLQIIDLSFQTKSKEELITYFSQYCLNLLSEYRDAFDSCRSILTDKQSTTTSGIPKQLYDYYQLRYSVVDELYKKRELDVTNWNNTINRIKEEQSNFNKSHDLATYLGSDLYKIFCSYIREDSYQNSNFISDGYEDNTEKLMSIAKELLDNANKDIRKACKLQRTISTNLNNLFMLEEFENLWDKFVLMNYIRVKTEDEIFKARIIGVEYSGDSLSEISVTFSDKIESIDGSMSDLTSIIQQASSMSSSYNATMLQAQQGSVAQNTFLDIYSQGLNATKMALKNNDNNEVIINNSGIICRRMDDEGIYGDKQLRITGNIMAFTDDNWKNVRMGIGEIDLIDPDDTSKSEKKYGIIADAIVGKLIVGERMNISNHTGNVDITGNGIKIQGGSIKISKDANNYTEINPQDNDCLFKIVSNNKNIISATSSTATICGFTATDTALYTGELNNGSGIALSNSDFSRTINATEINELRFAIGNSFGVNKTGKLYCKDADLSGGKITGGSGEFTQSFKVDVPFNDYNTVADFADGIITFQTIYNSKPVAGFTLNNETIGMYSSNGTIELQSKTNVYKELYVTPGNSGSILRAGENKTCQYENSVGAISAAGSIYLYSQGSATGNRGLYTSNNGGTAKSIISIDKDNNATFYGNATTAKNVSGGGTVSCTTVSASSTVTATGNVTTSGNFVVSNNNGLYLTNIDNYLIHRWSSDDSSVYSAYHTRVGNGNMPLGLIGKDNTYSNNKITVTSDERIKKDFESLEQYENWFYSIKPYSYKYKNGASGRNHIGYKAQQIKQSLEDFEIGTGGFAGYIEMPTDPDLKEYINDDTMCGLRYEEFIALNTHMIQKQKQEIEQLKQELKELKGKIKQ